jgi:hypothetical protein
LEKMHGEKGGREKPRMFSEGETQASYSVSLCKMIKL